MFPGKPFHNLLRKVPFGRKEGFMMIGKTIEELQVGDKAEFAKTISESDVYLYAGITGDFNPAHIDESYAEKTFFKTRIAQGMLLGGFISAILGYHLPGPGTIYVRQELNFLSPARIGDTVTSRAEVIDVIREKNRVRLKTTSTNQNGVLLVEGEAVVSPPKKAMK
jgi:3-hydroxybutyryl-CoA dehydratase